MRDDAPGRPDDPSQGSTAGFASEGAGQRTRQLHRTVVLFVVVMLGGLVGHAIALLAT